MLATRVGVQRTRNSDKAACQRCGKERNVRSGPIVPYCGDCRTVDPEYHQMVGGGFYNGRKHW